MKSKISRFWHEEWLQLLLLALPLIAAVAAMSYATERVPMQWGFNGQVNWTAPKGWGLLVLPGSMVLILALIFGFESRDPARHRDADGQLTSHGRATRAIRLGLSVVLGAFTLVQIAYALGRHPDGARVVPSLIAMLFAFLGNYFGKLKPNRYAGIRVPWTLNSETVWRETHRAAGWLWTASSLIMLVLIWLLPDVSQMKWLQNIWLAVLLVGPLFVAWRSARRERLINRSSH